ncbi:sensor histidine kinase [Flavobacteriaceae bacterium S356]|uniref:histidine kinase n=1 Tax=Asprobacillus argus TaxID=3076534 RepID=A0ABU3LFE4_9FLAO|nr:sensor histidine kinase [Flavobacteriaceae bacterium S356]
MSSRKFYIHFLFLLFAYTSSFANAIQDQEFVPDKKFYSNLLDTTSNGTVTFKSFDSIKSFIDKKRHISFFEKTVDLALKYEAYETAMKIVPSIYFNIAKTKEQSERAMAILRKLQGFESKVDKTRLIGELYSYEGFHQVYFDLKRSKELFTKAIQKFKLTGPIEINSIGLAYLYRAKTQKFMGQYGLATQDYIKSSKFFEQIEDTLPSARTLYFQALSENASIYTSIGMSEMSFEKISEIIDRKEKTNFLAELANDYYMLSNALYNLKEPAKRKKALLKSIQYGDIENPSILVAAYSDLCELSIEEKQLSVAKKYLDTLENIINKTPFTTQKTRGFLRTKAAYLASIDRYDEAGKILTNLLKESKKSSYQQRTAVILDFSYKVNLWKKNYAQALDYFEKKTILEDSLASVKNKQLYQYYQTIFETEKKEKEIIAQQKDIEILDTKNQAKTKIIALGGISLLSLFFVVLLVVKRKQVKKDKQAQEEYSQKLLITQEEERKRISEDLHDSLGQTLLLIKNSIISDEKEQEESLINSAIEEMRAISKLLHPYQLEEIGLQKSTENLIQQLDDSYKETYIFGDIENVDTLLTISQKLNVFRIIQECLSNIIKHANATSAKVELKARGKQVVLSVKDNGEGFNSFEKYKNFKTLGLKTIKERVKYLKGTLNIDSKINKGTVFSITFPSLN